MKPPLEAEPVCDLCRDPVPEEQREVLLGESMEPGSVGQERTLVLHRACLEVALLRGALVDDGEAEGEP